MGYRQAGEDLLFKVQTVFAHLNQGFSFIIAPHGTGSAVTLNLSGRLTVVLAIVVVAFVTGLAFVGVTYTRLALLALETERLETENQLLRMENEKISEIEQEIARIDQVRRQIEAWAGILPGEMAEAASLDDLAIAPNVWPRRYTYALLKPYYLQRSGYPLGMLVPATGWISRRFIGEGTDKPIHPGIDIAASTGTPVRCAQDGLVSSAGWDDIYGNLIVVEHDDSLKTAYGHNDRILVKEGDHVVKGQVIATVGNTGRSTAPHLHFAVLKHGQPVDPELYVDFKTK